MENVIERKLPKIYVADTQDENSLIEFFQNNENFDFVGSSSDGSKVVEDVKRLQPDVLVMGGSFTKS